MRGFARIHLPATFKKITETTQCSFSGVVAQQRFAAADAEEPARRVANVSRAPACATRLRGFPGGSGWVFSAPPLRSLRLCGEHIAVETLNHHEFKIASK